LRNMNEYASLTLKSNIDGQGVFACLIGQCIKGSMK